MLLNKYRIVSGGKILGYLDVYNNMVIPESLDLSEYKEYTIQPWTTRTDSVGREVYVGDIIKTHLWGNCEVIQLKNGEFRAQPLTRDKNHALPTGAQNLFVCGPF